MNHAAHSPAPPSLNRTALSATIHCLTGCAIGEVLGMILGNMLGWNNMFTAAVSIGLAFLFGYSLTLLPLVRSGLALGTALGLAFASDTLSIAVMEVIDNAIMLAVPGAMDAGLSTMLFWGTMILSLVTAGAVAFPINRWLISRGRGHAVVHAYHGGHASDKHASHARRAVHGAGAAACCGTACCKS
jgi:hypothetical protein